LPGAAPTVRLVHSPSESELDMRKALAVLLVLAVTSPLHAQKPIKTVSPDEALKHRKKWVNVCGIVREAANTDKGGKLYFESASGEAIWASPILDLATRVNELPGARVCAYGRVYWNLEGLGIDTERVEFVAANDAAPRDVVPRLTVTATAAAVAPCRVLLTPDRAESSWYEPLQDIRFTKRFHPTSEGARKDLAKRAHALGADAVLEVEIESKRTVLSYPNSIIEASGRAVKWTAAGRERSFDLRGSCYGVKGQPFEQVARPRGKFPWEAVIGAAAVAAVAYGAYQFGKDGDAARSGVPAPAPTRHAPTQAPRAEKAPPRGIDLGAYSGATSRELIVLSGDGSRTFLGCLSCSEFDTSSIRNDYGRHGEYGGDSIRNSYSRYGSPYAATSACNRYASQPPIIVDRSGNFYGELTMNEYRTNRTRMETALAWLAAVCR
jgi:hypothetical protein